MLGEYPTNPPVPEETSSQPNRTFLIAGGAVALVAAVGLVWWLSSPPAPTSTAPDARSGPVAAADPLALALKSLTEGTDPNTCRVALQQLNLHLAANEADRPPAATDLSPFGLAPDELAEVNSNTFTLLDAHHLELAYLLRDAARSLGVEGAPTRDQVNAAFAWVTRQVRLREPKEPTPPVPPQFVLRRGWGSSVERSLVFLALIEQLPTPAVGCLVGPPDKNKDAGLQPWACAAVVEENGKKEVLLFDPRLGVALPFTRGEVLSRPEALKALTVDDKLPYDVTPEQVKTSALYLAAPLSALAPRMRTLQAKLQGATPTAVRLADPLDALKRLRDAVSQHEGQLPAVAVWRPAVEIQRRFWPATEGGTDTASRLDLLRVESIPRDKLPAAVWSLSGDAGNTVRAIYSVLFVQVYTDFKGPRELTLRGRFQQALPQLVQTRQQIGVVRDRFGQERNLDEKVARWRDAWEETFGDVTRLRANLARSKTPDTASQLKLAEAEAVLQQLIKEMEPVVLMASGISAQVWAPEATFQLALCKHEEAEQLEHRLAQAKRAGREPVGADTERLRETWTDAAGWWEACQSDPSPLTTVAARRNWARCLERLGKKDQALTLLRDPSGDLTPWDKTAHLYLAQRLEKGSP